MQSVERAYRDTASSEPEAEVTHVAARHVAAQDPPVKEESSISSLNVTLAGFTGWSQGTLALNFLGVFLWM